MEIDSCYGKFLELIPTILEKEPMTTPELYVSITIALPECISEETCTHGSDDNERNDYEWQHSVRRAQYYLKNKGKIELLDHVWYWPKNPSAKDEAEEKEGELIYEKQDLLKIREELRSLTSKETEWVNINGTRIKRDNLTVARLKVLRGFKCQICDTRIDKRDGKFYAEGAHIKPKKGGFPETPDNILILCPNHHKEFDLGKRDVLEHNSEYIRFLLNGKEYIIGLSV
jgi:predicted restriction endonuclease